MNNLRSIRFLRHRILENNHNNAIYFPKNVIGYLFIRAGGYYLYNIVSEKYKTFKCLMHRRTYT